MDRLNALRERLHQRWAPPKWSKGRGILVGLFVGLREELERRIGWRNVLPHGDQELDVAARLPLLHGEMMQHAQLFGRLVLSEAPFNHSRAPSGTIAQAGRGTHLRYNQREEETK